MRSSLPTRASIRCFICMFLSLATTQQYIVVASSSCRVVYSAKKVPSSSFSTFGKNCIKHQRQRRCRYQESHRHHNCWGARLAFTTSLSTSNHKIINNYSSSISAATSYRNYHPLSSPYFSLRNNKKRMSPRNNNGMSSLSSLAMSAVEETLGTSQQPSSSSSNDNHNNNNNSQTAKLVPSTLPSLQLCGERLRSGHLVSFPTETVYGLGCHALDPNAVQKVFDAKERPLSDPLIVHVTESCDALELWDASTSLNHHQSTISTKTTTTTTTDNEQQQQQQRQQQQQQQIEKTALQTLTSTFFPGPLTLVARAHPTIPQILMANTGYVACRSPSHPIARALIEAAQCPIAAPSANKFGHVSPTLARHVMDDLGREDVWIVDPKLGGLVDGGNDTLGGQKSERIESSDDGSTVCQVGVESTVAKIEMIPATNNNSNNNSQNNNSIIGQITILRHGAISSQSIRDALQTSNLSQYFTVSDSVKFTSEKVHNVAPGQTIKHYSPNVPCFMMGVSRQRQRQQQQQQQQQNYINIANVMSNPKKEKKRKKREKIKAKLQTRLDKIEAKQQQQQQQQQTDGQLNVMGFVSGTQYMTQQLSTNTEKDYSVFNGNIIVFVDDEKEGGNKNREQRQRRRRRRSNDEDGTERRMLRSSSE
mmetsp:Transcript_46367/g.97450  ORF Transcript_46367/g.97450 Transcript_46367/m.97450 type:complete len:649 (+) Transcript_46367:142-2088(+)